MSNLPQKLTRNQLAEFLPNARAVRAFEQLLKQVGDLVPSDIATITRLIQETYIEASSGTAKGQAALDQLNQINKTAAINAGTADAKATAALDALNSIARSLQLLSSAPAQRQDNSVVTDYIDVSPVAPKAADKLGRFKWNQALGTIELTLAGGNATWGSLSGGAAGSMPYQTAAYSTTFLGIGTAGQVLQVNAGATAPEWVSSTGTGNVVRATSPALVKPTADGLTVGKGASSLSANSAFGVSALAGVTTGNGLTAVGYQALTGVTTTGDATAMGYLAGASIVAGGIQSAFYGYLSGQYLTGSYNTAAGAYSLRGTNGSATGQYNTAFGLAAGQNLTSGTNNSFFGIYVGSAIQGGSGNTAFGGNASANAAGGALTSGSNNSLFGGTAGGAINTGSSNSVLGNFTGNQSGVDIRTKSNYIVLSDGAGTPQQVITPLGTQEFAQGTGKFPKLEGFFSWANVPSVTQDLATLFPEAVFTSGSISLVLQILTGSNTANAASVVYNLVRQTAGGWTASLVNSVTGGVTISSVTGSGTSITITFSVANQYGLCNVSALVNT